MKEHKMMMMRIKGKIIQETVMIELINFSEFGV